MLANRSFPRTIVIPELAYPDLTQAIDWLTSAFGFTLRLRIADHRAQLNVGDEIQVESLADAALNRSLIIQPDGTVTLRLLGQVNWFGWSSFQEIRVVPEKGPAIVDPQNFHDTFSLAGGVEWEVIDGLRLRTGFQYDETPTVDEFRNSRIPDADRYLLAAGASYRVTDSIEATLGYLHGFVKDATFQPNRQFYPSTPLLTSYRFRADASAMVNVIGVGLTYRF